VVLLREQVQGQRRGGEEVEMRGGGWVGSSGQQRGAQGCQGEGCPVGASGGPVGCSLEGEEGVPCQVHLGAGDLEVVQLDVNGTEHIDAPKHRRLPGRGAGAGHHEQHKR